MLLDEKYKDAVLLHTNKSVIIEVPFKASPQPKVKWQFNGSHLPDIKRTTHQTIYGMTALTISRAKRSDAGTYSLLLENEFGKATASVKVKVIDKPGPPENVTVKDITSSSVTLRWAAPHDEGGVEVTGYTVEKREGNRRMWQNVGSTSDREMVIDRLIDGNQYHLRVSAENVVGTSEPAELPQVVVCKSQFGK